MFYLIIPALTAVKALFLIFCIFSNSYSEKINIWKKLPTKQIQKKNIVKPKTKKKVVRLHKSKKLTAVDVLEKALSLAYKKAQSERFTQLIKKVQKINFQISEKSLLIYVIKFFQSYGEYSWFICANQGKLLLETGIASILSPPDLEFFLYSLNYASERANITLQPDYRFPTEYWVLPNPKILSEYSHLFYLLKSNQMNELPELNLEPSLKFYDYLLLSYWYARNSSFKHNQPTKSKFNLWQPNLESNSDYVAASIENGIKSKRNGINTFQKYVALLHLGFLYQSQNSEEKAIEIMKKSIKLHETSHIHLRLAEWYIKNKDWTRGKEHNDKAIKLDPDAQPISAPIPSTK
jgi:tetratricopeptide (TPR) repeat protein